MKIVRPSYLVFIVFISLSFSSIAAKSRMDTMAITDKFDYIKERANDYNSLRWWCFTLLKPQILDTMNQFKGEISTLNLSIDKNEKQIDSLAHLNTKTRAELNKTIQEKESMVFLGISLQKATYNIIMWGIVAVLAFVLVMLFLMYKQSHLLTRNTKNDLNELKMEFEAFRKRALEREEGIVRKFHNELSKYKSKSSNLSK